MTLSRVAYPVGRARRSAKPPDVCGGQRHRGIDEKLLKAAVALVKAANKQLDVLMPAKLAEIVKVHAALGVGAAWIPIPGADMAAGVAAIWGMYYRINGELQLPFAENVVKSVASGVGTNLAAYLGVLGVASMLKFIPGLGTVAGAVAMSAAAYALTLASGYVYMKVLTLLLGQKNANDITQSDLKEAVAQVMSDKDDVKSFIHDAKKSARK